ncbi:putative periplasmic serine endoprotease DegP-like precursor [Symmachiella macrocystis]|uniref:Putative periplasmic serine endoprotease DegP-like n=1 Tax=Symmachiella macrocystis TaxID=2527985 RepID=A0A5C6BCZ6_9PLAN|nr:trypsin-like peptidase domain-containing protein [Symmachiella macrocystis]TWU09166.1 putative periplasmic serine endoprotease DegP-like precursor [Symmachiella macrocystis]
MLSKDERPPRRAPIQADGVSWPFLILVVLALFAIWRFSGTGASSILNPDASARAVTPRGDLAADEKTTIEIFQKVAPSVVHITAVDQVTNPLAADPVEVPSGIGSGLVWSDDGYIVTNFHVISQAKGVVVTLGDGTVLKAKLVGKAPDQDLAVLKVDAPASQLVPIPIGESSNLMVGQKVFAIGNPFGFDHSLSTGTISGLGRSIRMKTRRLITDVIQTDAAINRGSSGGPLLDSAGRLIGVTTAIYSPSGVSAGLGFSVPVDMVNRVVPELIQHGKIERPGLGIRPVLDQLTHRLGLEGILIEADEDGSMKTRSGIRPTYWDDQANQLVVGDLIIAMDGEPLRGSLDLIDELSKRKVGDVVELTLWRDGKEVNQEIELQAIP